MRDFIQNTITCTGPHKYRRVCLVWTDARTHRYTHTHTQALICQKTHTRKHTHTLTNIIQCQKTHAQIHTHTHNPVSENTRTHAQSHTHNHMSNNTHIRTYPRMHKVLYFFFFPLVLASDTNHTKKYIQRKDEWKCLICASELFRPFFFLMIHHLSALHHAPWKTSANEEHTEGFPGGETYPPNPRTA